MPFQLIAIAGPLKGHIVDVLEGELSIGRLSSNHICIQDPILSREHCRLSLQSERVTLRDSGSLHGTFVGGIPIKERVLQPGDEIRIGESALLFVDAWRGAVPAQSPVEEQPLGIGTTIEVAGDGRPYR